MTILGTSGLVLNEKLLFEHSDPGRKGYSLPQLDVHRQRAIQTDENR